MHEVFLNIYLATKQFPVCLLGKWIILFESKTKEDLQA